MKIWSSYRFEFDEGNGYKLEEIARCQDCGNLFSYGIKEEGHLAGDEAVRLYIQVSILYTSEMVEIN